MKLNTNLLFRLVLFTVIVGWACISYAQNDSLPVDGFEVPEQAVAEVAAIDTTTNESQAIASKRLSDVLRNGGPLMIPILLCSFVLVVFTFERLISLRKGRIIPSPFAKKFVDQLSDGSLDKKTAIELV